MRVSVSRSRLSASSSVSTSLRASPAASPRGAPQAPPTFDLIVTQMDTTSLSNAANAAHHASGGALTGRGSMRRASHDTASSLPLSHSSSSSSIRRPSVSSNIAIESPSSAAFAALAAAAAGGGHASDDVEGSDSFSAASPTSPAPRVPRPRHRAQQASISISIPPPQTPAVYVPVPLHHASAIGGAGLSVSGVAGRVSGAAAASSPSGGGGRPRLNDRRPSRAAHSRGPLRTSPSASSLPSPTNGNVAAAVLPLQRGGGEEKGEGGGEVEEEFEDVEGGLVDGGDETDESSLADDEALSFQGAGGDETPVTTMQAALQSIYREDLRRQRAAQLDRASGVARASRLSRDAKRRIRREIAGSLDGDDAHPASWLNDEDATTTTSHTDASASGVVTPATISTVPVSPALSAAPISHTLPPPSPLPPPAVSGAPLLDESVSAAPAEAPPSPLPPPALVVVDDDNDDAASATFLTGVEHVESVVGVEEVDDGVSVASSDLPARRVESADDDESDADEVLTNALLQQTPRAAAVTVVVPPTAEDTLLRPVVRSTKKQPPRRRGRSRHRAQKTSSSDAALPSPPPLPQPVESAPVHSPPTTTSTIPSQWFTLTSLGSGYVSGVRIRNQIRALQTRQEAFLRELRAEEGASLITDTILNHAWFQVPNAARDLERQAAAEEATNGASNGTDASSTRHSSARSSSSRPLAVRDQARLDAVIGFFADPMDSEEVVKAKRAVAQDQHAMLKKVDAAREQLKHLDAEGKVVFVYDAPVPTSETDTRSNTPSTRTNTASGGVAAAEGRSRSSSTTRLLVSSSSTSSLPAGSTSSAAAKPAGAGPMAAGGSSSSLTGQSSSVSPPLSLLRQGDLSMYTIHHLLDREALKFHPEVLVAVREWWHTAAKLLPPHAHLVGKAEYFNILRLLYYVLVDCDVAVPEKQLPPEKQQQQAGAPSSSSTRASAAALDLARRRREFEATLESDWSMDARDGEKPPAADVSSGEDGGVVAVEPPVEALNFAQFHRALHQLADAWTFTLDGGEYAYFLRALLAIVTEAEEDAEGHLHRAWRTMPFGFDLSDLGYERRHRLSETLDPHWLTELAEWPTDDETDLAHLLSTELATIEAEEAREAAAFPSLSEVQQSLKAAGVDVDLSGHASLGRAKISAHVANSAGIGSLALDGLIRDVTGTIVGRQSSLNAGDILDLESEEVIGSVALHRDEIELELNKAVEATRKAAAAADAAAKEEDAKNKAASPTRGTVGGTKSKAPSRSVSRSVSRAPTPPPLSPNKPGASDEPGVSGGEGGPSVASRAQKILAANIVAAEVAAAEAEGLAQTAARRARKLTGKAVMASMREAGLIGRRKHQAAAASAAASAEALRAVAARLKASTEDVVAGRTKVVRAADGHVLLIKLQSRVAKSIQNLKTKAQAAVTLRAKVTKARDTADAAAAAADGSTVTTTPQGTARSLKSDLGFKNKMARLIAETATLSNDNTDRLASGDAKALRASEPDGTLTSPILEHQKAQAAAESAAREAEAARVAAEQEQANQLQLAAERRREAEAQKQARLDEIIRKLTTSVRNLESDAEREAAAKAELDRKHEEARARRESLKRRSTGDSASFRGSPGAGSRSPNRAARQDADGNDATGSSFDRAHRWSNTLDQFAASGAVGGGGGGGGLTPGSPGGDSPTRRTRSHAAIEVIYDAASGRMLRRRRRRRGTDEVGSGDEGGESDFEYELDSGRWVHAPSAAAAFKSASKRMSFIGASGSGATGFLGPNAGSSFHADGHSTSKWRSGPDRFKEMYRAIYNQHDSAAPPFSYDRVGSAHTSRSVSPTAGRTVGGAGGVLHGLSRSSSRSSHRSLSPLLSEEAFETEVAKLTRIRRERAALAAEKLEREQAWQRKLDLVRRRREARARGETFEPTPDEVELDRRFARRRSQVTRPPGRTSASASRGPSRAASRATSRAGSRVGSSEDDDDIESRSPPRASTAERSRSAALREEERLARDRLEAHMAAEEMREKVETAKRRALREAEIAARTKALLGDPAEDGVIDGGATSPHGLDERRRSIAARAASYGGGSRPSTRSGSALSGRPRIGSAAPRPPSSRLSSPPLSQRSRSAAPSSAASSRDHRSEAASVSQSDSSSDNDDDDDDDDDVDVADGDEKSPTATESNVPLSQRTAAERAAAVAAARAARMKMMPTYVPRQSRIYRSAPKKEAVVLNRYDEAEEERAREEARRLATLKLQLKAAAALKAKNAKALARVHWAGGDQATPLVPLAPGGIGVAPSTIAPAALGPTLALSSFQVSLDPGNARASHRPSIFGNRGGAHVAALQAAAAAAEKAEADAAAATTTTITAGNSTEAPSTEYLSPASVPRSRRGSMRSSVGDLSPSVAADLSPGRMSRSTSQETLSPGHHMRSLSLIALAVAGGGSAGVGASPGGAGAGGALRGGKRRFGPRLSVFAAPSTTHARSPVKAYLANLTRAAAAEEKTAAAVTSPTTTTTTPDERSMFSISSAFSPGHQRKPSAAVVVPRHPQGRAPSDSNTLAAFRAAAQLGTVLITPDPDPEAEAEGEVTTTSGSTASPTTPNNATSVALTVQVPSSQTSPTVLPLSPTSPTAAAADRPSPIAAADRKASLTPRASLIRTRSNSQGGRAPPTTTHHKRSPSKALTPTSPTVTSPSNKTRSIPVSPTAASVQKKKSYNNKKTRTRDGKKASRASKTADDRRFDISRSPTPSSMSESDSEDSSSDASSSSDRENEDAPAASAPTVSNEKHQDKSVHVTSATSETATVSVQPTTSTSPISPTSAATTAPAPVTSADADVDTKHTQESSSSVVVPAVAEAAVVPGVIAAPRRGSDHHQDHQDLGPWSTSAETRRASGSSVTAAGGGEAAEVSDDDASSGPAGALSSHRSSLSSAHSAVVAAVAATATTTTNAATTASAPSALSTPTRRPSTHGRHGPSHVTFVPKHSFMSTSSTSSSSPAGAPPPPPQVGQRVPKRRSSHAAGEKRARGSTVSKAARRASGSHAKLSSGGAGAPPVSVDLSLDSRSPPNESTWSSPRGLSLASSPVRMDHHQNSSLSTTSSLRVSPAPAMSTERYITPSAHTAVDGGGGINIIITPSTDLIDEVDSESEGPKEEHANAPFADPTITTTPPTGSIATPPSMTPEEVASGAPEDPVPFIIIPTKFKRSSPGAETPTQARALSPAATSTPLRSGTSSVRGISPAGSVAGSPAPPTAADWLRGFTADHPSENAIFAGKIDDEKEATTKTTTTSDANNDAQSHTAASQPPHAVATAQESESASQNDADTDDQDAEKDSSDSGPSFHLKICVDLAPSSSTSSLPVISQSDDQDAARGGVTSTTVSRPPADWASDSIRPHLRHIIHLGIDEESVETNLPSLRGAPTPLANTPMNAAMASVREKVGGAATSSTTRGSTAASNNGGLLASKKHQQTRGSFAALGASRTSSRFAFPKAPPNHSSATGATAFTPDEGGLPTSTISEGVVPDTLADPTPESTSQFALRVAAGRTLTEEEIAASAAADASRAITKDIQKLLQQKNVVGGIVGASGASDSVSGTIGSSPARVKKPVRGAVLSQKASEALKATSSFPTPGSRDTDDLQLDATTGSSLDNVEVVDDTDEAVTADTGATGATRADSPRRSPVHSRANSSLAPSPKHAHARRRSSLTSAAQLSPSSSSAASAPPTGSTGLSWADTRERIAQRKGTLAPSGSEVKSTALVIRAAEMPESQVEAVLLQRVVHFAPIPIPAGHARRRSDAAAEVFAQSQALRETPSSTAVLPVPPVSNNTQRQSAAPTTPVAFGAGPFVTHTYLPPARVLTARRIDDDDQSSATTAYTTAAASTAQEHKEREREHVATISPNLLSSTATAASGAFSLTIGAITPAKQRFLKPKSRASISIAPPTMNATLRGGSPTKQQQLLDATMTSDEDEEAPHEAATKSSDQLTGDDPSLTEVEAASGTESESESMSRSSRAMSGPISPALTFRPSRVRLANFNPFGPVVVEEQGATHAGRLQPRAESSPKQTPRRAHRRSPTRDASRGRASRPYDEVRARLAAATTAETTEEHRTTRTLSPKRSKKTQQLETASEATNESAPLTATTAAEVSPLTSDVPVITIGASKSAPSRPPRSRRREYSIHSRAEVSLVGTLVDEAARTQTDAAVVPRRSWVDATQSLTAELAAVSKGTIASHSHSFIPSSSRSSVSASGVGASSSVLVEEKSAEASSSTSLFPPVSSPVDTSVGLFPSRSTDAITPLARVISQGEIAAAPPVYAQTARSHREAARSSHQPLSARGHDSIASSPPLRPSAAFASLLPSPPSTPPPRSFGLVSQGPTAASSGNVYAPPLLHLRQAHRGVTPSPARTGPPRYPVAQPPSPADFTPRFTFNLPKKAAPIR